MVAGVYDHSEPQEGGKEVVPADIILELLPHHGILLFFLILISLPATTVNMILSNAPAPSVQAHGTELQPCGHCWCHL